MPKGVYVRTEENIRMIREAAKKKAADPEWQNKMQEAGKKRAADPKWQKSNRAAMKKLAADPVYQEKHRKAMKKLTLDPEWRERNREALQEQAIDPEVQKKKRMTMTKLVKDAKYQDNFREGIKKRGEDPTWQEKIQKRAADPEWRKKIREAARRHQTDVDSFLARFPYVWYGIVIHDNEPLYCQELWTPELRERVRGSHGYCCVLCGTPQNGSRLHAHHVLWNKKACCDASKRYIVPLCAACHGLIKGNKKKSKQEWIAELVYLCEHYYCLDFDNHDKSFLSKEQWNFIKKAPRIPPETRYSIDLHIQIEGASV